jgi:hypothetical protein
MIHTFSYFKAPIKNTTPTRDITMEEVFSLIANDGKLAEVTRKLRTTKDQAKRAVIKEKDLPYVCFSGTFSTRKKEGLINYSGLIAADLDHLDGSITTAWDTVRTETTPLLMFQSPSGDGIKAVYSVDRKQGSHEEYVSAIVASLARFFPIKKQETGDKGIDAAAMTIPQACFLCHDPDVYLAKEETVLGKDFLTQYKPKSIIVKPREVDTVPEINSSSDKVEVIAPPTRIPKPSKGGIIVKANPPDPDKIYRKMVDWTERGGLTFVKGYRNRYITTLVGACHRFALDLEYVLGQVRPLEQEDFPARDIEAIVRSIYSNHGWDGTAIDDKDAKQSSITPPQSRPVETKTPAPHTTTTATETKDVKYEVKDQPEPKTDLPFVRVGTAIYKVIDKANAWGVKEQQLKGWNKDAFLIDYSKYDLRALRQYDDFCMYPSNTDYKSVVNGCLNLYAPFPWTPKEGGWLWIGRLMNHIFGEQIELGMRYMKILYEYPERSTVILCIVSTERETGKSTFLDFLDMIFGANCARIGAGEFLTAFNNSYATKNLLCIDETLFEKSMTTEKLKMLSTAKVLPVNEKYLPVFKVPYYGKIILASNHEKRFAKIDPEEVRFFIRKVGKPKYINHDIRMELLKEIPAFLHHLKTLPPVDWSVSRSGFTRDELYNTELSAVIQESMSGLFKDLSMEITELFENGDADEIYATPKDIKEKFFSYDKSIGLSYIRRVLREEFNLKPAETPFRYSILGDKMGSKKFGRPYKFERIDFTSIQKGNDAF